MKVSAIHLILKSVRFFYGDDDDVFSSSMQRKSISIQFLFQLYSMRTDEYYSSFRLTDYVM